MPKVVDPDELRIRILDGALRTIGTTGFEGTRLRDIAGACGLTTGAVTHYFDNKDQLIEDALAHVVARTLARMTHPKPNPPQPLTVERFIKMVQLFLPLDETGLQEWKVWLAFWGRAVGDERLLQLHQRYYAELTEQIIPWVALLPCGAGLSKAQLRELSVSVIGALDGVGVRATLDAARWPAARQRRALSRLMTGLLETPNS